MTFFNIKCFSIVLNDYLLYNQNSYYSRRFKHMAISKDNIQISVVLPRNLVENHLDIEAKQELRTRSKQIAKIITDYYSNKK